MFDIDAALRYVVKKEGSDLHVKVDSPPMVSDAFVAPSGLLGVERSTSGRCQREGGVHARDAAAASVVSTARALTSRAIAEFSHDDLRDYACEHVYYEVDMFVRKRRGHRRCERRDWPMNVSLEVFTIHPRNLLDFFYPPRKQYETDVFAKHLLHRLAERGQAVWVPGSTAPGGLTYWICASRRCAGPG